LITIADYPGVLAGYRLMHKDVEMMIGHRKAAIALLAKARTAGDQSVTKGFEKIVREWDRLLAAHGVGAENGSD
jgi:hypothetical protein